MSRTKLLGTIEVTINDVIKRLSKLEGLEKTALYMEYKEWIDSINSYDKHYDVLFLKKLDGY